MVRAITEGTKSQTRRVGSRYAKWQPGDRLWVKENFYVQPELWADGHGPQPREFAADVGHRDEVEDYVLKPSIFMPRWASRLDLLLVAKRVERLRVISEADLLAEGFQTRWDFWNYWDSLRRDPKFWWRANPCVWVLTFEREEKP